MADETLSGHIAAFATDIYADGVPPAVEHSTVQRVMDIVGLCVAAVDLPTSRAVLDHVMEQGGAERAHGIGCRTLVPASSAAFLNGVLAHSLDYDDTHLPSVLHPSAAVVPAALAAAEQGGATGAQLIRAVAVGLDVTVRLGMAGYDENLGNSVYFEHGQHATSICGAMGAAVAATLLLGMGKAEVMNALGVTASMAAGIIEGNRTGGTVKRIHCGLAAQSAVSSAELVRRGITGPPTVLEGRFGFFEAWLHGSPVNLDVVTDRLGHHWTVPGIFFKPYPANHFTHAAVDAGRELRARGVTPERVRRLRLGVAEAPRRTIGEPIESKRAPETGYQAQFSGPYALVAGLLGGHGLGVGLADFTDELARDEFRRRLMDRVDVVTEPRCDKIFPHQFPAIVHAELTDGAEEVVEVLVNRGGPENPLSDDELAVKFRDNVAGHLDDDARARLETLLRRLPELTDLREVMSLAAGATPPPQPAARPPAGSG